MLTHSSRYPKFWGFSWRPAWREVLMFLVWVSQIRREVWWLLSQTIGEWCKRCLFFCWIWKQVFGWRILSYPAKSWCFPACQARVSRLITYIIYVRTYATWKLPDQAPDYKSESMSNICRLKCAGADVRIHVRLHVKICVRWKFYRSNVRIDIRTTVRTCDPKIPKLSE
jgi:hypothetical protein